MELVYTWKNILCGWVVYAAGDTIASLLLGEFSLVRLLSMMLIGSTIYALEIPNYFRWIERITSVLINRAEEGLAKTVLAITYFNPLWIARHLLFIKLISGKWMAVGWHLVWTGTLSFIVHLPVLVIGNMLIQMKLPIRWRFFGSAVFSGLLAIYYPLSAVIFGG